MTQRLPAVAMAYQGFGNVGDEAVLAGIETMLESSCIDVTTIIGGNAAPIPAYAEATRIVSRRLFPSFAAVRSLRRTRLLLMTGGGLLHDHWWNVVPLYFSWTVLARLCGSRVLWIGIGVGPLHRRVSRYLIGSIGWLSSLLTVRDQQSAELVRAVGARSVYVIPDPAFFVARPEPRARSGIGIIVRAPTPRDDALTNSLADAFGALYVQLTTEKTDCTILSMAGAVDQEFVTRVSSAVVERTGRPPRIEPLPIAPSAAVGRLAEFDAVVSMRLHGLILAAVAETPCVPISYDAKVENVAARLGLSEVAIPLNEVSSGSMQSKLQVVQESALRAEVQERTDGLRGQMRDARRLVESAAGC